MAQPGVDGVPSPDPVPERRPRQVTIVSILLMVFGVLGILVTLVLLSIVNDDVDHGESVNGLAYVLVYGQIALSVVQIASGAFVWARQSWARVLAIVICSVNILGALFSLTQGAFLQVITGVALNIWLIILLNRDEVRDWCG